MLPSGSILFQPILFHSLSQLQLESFPEIRRAGKRCCPFQGQVEKVGSSTEVGQDWFRYRPPARDHVAWQSLLRINGHQTGKQRKANREAMVQLQPEGRCVHKEKQRHFTGSLRMGRAFLENSQLRTEGLEKWARAGS